MLRWVLFDTTTFGAMDDIRRSEKNVMWYLEALCQRNQEYLKQRPNTKRLYRSGVRYMLPQQFAGDVDEVKIIKAALGRATQQPSVRQALETIQEVLGGERFRDIGRIIENGGGDCDNLACWRVAELRQGGIKARPFMSNRKRPDGGTTYHALVIWPSLMALVKDGILSESVVRGRPDANYETTEDPSLLLGMGGAGRIPDRNVEIEKNRERCDLLRQAKGVRTDMLVSPGNIDSILDDVLGLRRRSIARQTVLGADAALLELDEIFKSAA